MSHISNKHNYLSTGIPTSKPKATKHAGILKGEKISRNEYLTQSNEIVYLNDIPAAAISVY